MVSGLITGILICQSLWAKTFGSSFGADAAYQIIQTSDGGFAVAGWTLSSGAGRADLLVLKLRSDGSLEWARTFGGPEDDHAWSILQTSDGGYVVAGETHSFGAGGSDFLILRITDTGALEWARTFGGPEDDGGYALSVIQTSDGGLALAGWTRTCGAGEADFMVMKLTSTGTLEWARTFGGPGDDHAWSIIQVSDAGFAVAGRTKSFGAGDYDFLVLRLTSTGGLVWARTFGGPGDDRARSVIQTSDGGFAVAGYSASFGPDDYDCLIVKLSGTGSLQWAKRYGEMGRDYAGSIVQVDDGGLAIAGWTYALGEGNYDFLALKLTSAGDILWAKTIGGPDNEIAYTLIGTNDGGFALAGRAWSVAVGSGDCFLVKIRGDGEYPGCAQERYLRAQDVQPIVSLQAMGSDCLPDASSPSPSVGNPEVIATDVCAPGVEEDNPSRSRITCSPIPGGMILNSSVEGSIRIYSADGRLVYSGFLGRGENRFLLDPGVYLWSAASLSGKALVR
ncbi:MAG: hypothetical protein ABIM59_04500 [candidate division WOR-3 bacterium]